MCRSELSFLSIQNRGVQFSITLALLVLIIINNYTDFRLIISDIKKILLTDRHNQNFSGIVLFNKLIGNRVLIEKWCRDSVRMFNQLIKVVFYVIPVFADFLTHPRSDNVHFQTIQVCDISFNKFLFYLILFFNYKLLVYLLLRHCILY